MTDLNSLITKYRSKGILVDTNILLLYFVGATNLDRIQKFSRTQQFDSKDYERLLQVLSRFEKIVTTPNILTEVNSLVGNKLTEPERSQWFKVFAQGISLLMQECYVESKTIATNERFSTFGITDCGIFNLAKNQYLVLTDDLKLAVHLQREGIDTINFNNIRLEI